MNQILVIIAIVGIGYLLYRSLIIKRQSTDADDTKTVKQSQNAAVESKPAEEAKRSAAENPTEAPTTTQTAQPAASVKPKPAAEENEVGAEAEQEAHHAEVKAAEKAHIKKASVATKSKLEQYAGSGMSSDSAPQAPAEVELQAKALGETEDPLARHRLFQQVVEQCYRSRDEKTARLALLHYARAHIAEFDDIKAPLKKQNGGKLPQVASFKHYAAVLTESGQYDEAIAICKKALDYGLKDGTKSGYQGRIERIEKLQAKQAG